ncbi:MAG: flagellar basal body rod protein FlgB [Rhizomicrobium sp.]|jgi:flagellar basal-body rod protein FlgB
MNFTDVPLFGMLRERMSWLNARQTVLSQNVANADAPGYTARDLKPLDFETMLKNASPSAFNTQLALTNPRDIAVANENTPFEDKDSSEAQATSSGNTVSLEEEMMKVADTQAQYQAATNLYAKAIGMFRTAIGQP